MRLGEKETLESTLKFFDDRIERLSELEFYQVRDCIVCAMHQFTLTLELLDPVNSKVLLFIAVPSIPLAPVLVWLAYDAAPLAVLRI